MNPYDPSLGTFVDPRLHAQGKQIITEDLRIEIPGQSADLRTDASPGGKVRNPTRTLAARVQLDPPVAEFPLKLAQEAIRYDHPLAGTAPVSKRSRESVSRVHISDRRPEPPG